MSDKQQQQKLIDKNISPDHKISTSIRVFWVVTTIAFLGSWTQFQHVDGDVWCFPIPTTSKALGHQLGGVLQFNSILRLKVAPDSTGEGLSPTKLSLH